MSKSLRYPSVFALRLVAKKIPDTGRIAHSDSSRQNQPSYRSFRWARSKFFSYDRSELSNDLCLCVTVADSTIGKELRTIADEGPVFSRPFDPHRDFLTLFQCV